MAALSSCVGRVAPAASISKRNARVAALSSISRFAVSPVKFAAPMRQARLAVVAMAQTPPGGKPKTDSDAPRVNPLTSAFTRRREIWVGRLAMFGWLAAYVGEILLRRGAIGQASYITGFSNEQVIAFLAFLVAFNAISAAGPGSPTWSDENQRDVRKRPTGPVQDPKINAASDPKQFLGVEKPGFSKSNELFVGRAAMLGFLAAVIGEVLTGKGALAQVANFVGIAADDGLYRIAGYGLLLSIVAITAIGYSAKNEGESATGEDIY